MTSTNYFGNTDSFTVLHFSFSPVPLFKAPKHISFLQCCCCIRHKWTYALYTHFCFHQNKEIYSCLPTFCRKWKLNEDLLSQSVSKLLSKSGSSGRNRGLMWLTYFVLDKAYVSIQNIVFTLLMSTNKVWKRKNIVRETT